MPLESIARLELGHFPTPLVPMPRLQAEVGSKQPLWIKHDDYSGPGFGGNKVRKLEYELAAARAAGATDVLTTGGLRSNHCRATAALAAQLGLRCHLVLNGTEPGVGAAEPASHWLDKMYGAQLHYVARGSDRAPALAALAEELRGQGWQPYVIPLGASSPLGACGFVRAVFEIKEQCEAHGFRPAAIVHSTSSAGTQAGLAAGLKLAGMDEVKLVGVSADDSESTITVEICRIVEGMEPLMRLAKGELASLVHVDDRFTGAGYGIPSAEGTAAAELLARYEGVVLDPVYTAKAMAGMLAMLPGLPQGEVLFWHTGGQLALFSRSI
ncbi:MAG: pyridoxal-phosphate dependent enzyme [Acidobacteriota bacterium]